MKSLIVGILSSVFFVDNIGSLPTYQTLRSRSSVEQIAHIDPVLVSFVNDFYHEKSKREVSPTYGLPVTSVTFGVVLNHTYAACYMGTFRINLWQTTFESVLTKPNNIVGWTFSGRRVVVEPNAWKSLTYQARRLMMFHEMAHCHFDLDHIDEIAEDGAPRSIMNSVLDQIVPQGTVLSKANEAIYIDTAFNFHGPHLNPANAKSMGYGH